MTQKDYHRITAAFVDAQLSYDLDEKTVDVLAACLADQLQADNPLFNREIFLTACGVE